MTYGDNMRGAGLMMLSMAAFTLNDTCVKLVGAHIPLMQLIFLRGLATSFLLWALARHLGAIRIRLPARDWGLIGLRALADVGATWLFLRALMNMPIANITAILQVLPLSVALAAWWFLGEPLGWRRLVAIAIGFVGVMLIVQPGGAGFSTWSLNGLGAVVFVTIRDLSARRLSPGTPSLTVALTGALAVMASAGLAAFIGGEWEAVGAREAGLILTASLFILGGYVFSVMVMRVGEIGFTAPFRYTGLIWALVLGFVVFGEWPDWLTLTGAGLVVAMGLFTLYREQQVRRAR